MKPKSKELPAVLNDEGAILLWKALCHQAVEDLYYGLHPRNEADLYYAKSAEQFIQDGLWYYLGDTPDARAIKQIHEKAKNWVPHRVIRSSLSRRDRHVPMYRPPAWKKRCLKCKYHFFDRASGFTNTARIYHVYCNYCVETGKKRPCRGENCTVFKERV